MKQTFVSKYEATKCMKQHIRSIHQNEPSKETTRWREDAPHQNAPVKHSKQQQYHKMDTKIESHNKMLSDRMYKVVTEDRVHRTKEAGPGWRSGVGGTVIDCYPTENKQVLYYKKFRNENRQRALEWKQHQLNEANVNFYSYLSATKTSYGVDQLAKEYAKNRVSYNLYANRPNTALTLGIYDVAAKELAKEKLKREGYRENLNYSSSELNHKIEELWQNRRNQTANANKIMKKLNDIKSVADFIDLNVISIEEKWNPAVNDNLRNSTSNYVMMENRLKPGYVKKREYHSSYLNDMPAASETISRNRSTNALTVDSSDDQPNVPMKIDYEQMAYITNSQPTKFDGNPRVNNRPSSRGINRSTNVNADMNNTAGSYDFNLYEPKSYTPPPPRTHRAKPVANSRPTSGGTMQFVDSSGIRDLTQYQHSIEEVSEFNFQNLKAEFLDHFHEDDVEVPDNINITINNDKNTTNSSPLKSRRPVSAGPIVMKVHHTKATAAAAAASILPPERPVSPKYAMPKLKPRSRSSSPVNTNKGVTVASPKTETITFHDDPADYLHFDQFNVKERRFSFEHIDDTRPATRHVQRPHSTGRTGLSHRKGGEYRDYSGNSFNSKKNVSFDNKLDSTIIVDYSNTSDSIPGVGSSSLEDAISNVVFMNQYGSK